MNAGGRVVRLVGKRYRVLAMTQTPAEPTYDPEELSGCLRNDELHDGREVAI